MSTNQHSQEEVDLGNLFGAIKVFFKRIAVLLYRFIRFLVRSWAILLALLIIGVVAGYFWQQNYRGKKEAELILRTNFHSTSYVYSAIDQLNASSFREDYQEEELPEIVKIEIEPIVRIEELFEDFRNEMAVIDLVEIFQDKKGQYSPESFIPRYSYHRVEVIFNQDATPESIDNLIAHLRANPLLQQVQEIGLQNLQQRLVDNQQMVRQVDDVLARVASTDGDVATANLMIMGSSGSLQLAEILEMKKELLEENDEIRENILEQQDLVVLINNPRLTVYNSFFANKIRLLPLILIFSYIIFFVLKAVYRKMKRIANN